ncbi:MAG TPA: putative sulfate/molybdate transporter [Bdellovibrionota bacterium]|nr:putative sulfate/molybdate transporter [Bdellovibrionota bacterium]
MKKVSFIVREIAGSFGDLPLFFIFVVGLVQLLNFNIASILFWSGLAHVLIGIIFKIPLPLQPMKAMGLYMMTFGLSQSEFLTAGFCLGLILLILSLSGAVKKLYQFIPEVVIRGIQVGLGLLFIKKAYELISFETSVFYSHSLLLLVLIGILFLFFKKYSYLLILSIFAIGFFTLFQQNLFQGAHIGFSVDFLKNHFGEFSFSSTVLLLILMQLPLTVTNSIFSPTNLIRDYFPKQKISETKIGLSLSLVNLLTCPFGAMPQCHGAGGLAAQVSFGARSGLSIIFLGCLKIVAALFFATLFFNIAKNFPRELLGLLFIFPAADLVARIRGVKVLEIPVLLATVVAFLFLNAAWALGIGGGIYFLLSSLRGRFLRTVKYGTTFSR